MSTPDTPQEQPQFDLGECTACNTDLGVSRNDYRSLILVCPTCGASRSIKIADMPPQDWEI